jgi:beta-phosphoglucomutase-like phosphatase (HAD superfamily)
VKVTLFDFNGVLVDDEPVHLEAFRDVLAPRGITITDAAYLERYFGFDDAGAFRAMLTDAGATPTDDEVRALVEAKKPRYMARIEGALRVFPGAPELVRRRAALGPVAIVSGALDHEIRYCLDVMGVADEIAFIVAAERCTACKPDPQGYLLAREELAERGVAADVIARAVVVEDSIAGIRAAKGAGLRCVAVAHSYARAELTAAGADAVAEDVASLRDEVIDG